MAKGEYIYSTFLMVNYSFNWYIYKTRFGNIYWLMHAG